MSWKNLLARALYPYGSTRRVLFGPLRHTRYVVSDGMGVSFGLGLAEHVPRASHYIRPGMTVFDVGANLGQFTLLAAQLVGGGGRLLALEPVPGLCAALRRNIELNHLSQVEVLNVAAAAGAGQAAFRFAQRHPSQGRLEGYEPDYPLSDSHLIEVQTQSLDEIAQDGGYRPDVIKIDVEGAAQAVFDGASHLLSDLRPDVYIELHGPREQQAVSRCLLSQGYSLCDKHGVPVQDPTARWISPIWASARAADDGAVTNRGAAQ